MEPIALNDHPMFVSKPWLQAKQAILDCGNGYGLSMVWAHGETRSRENLRWETGLYIDESSYEVALITKPSAQKPHFASILPCETDVIGWLSIEQVNALCEAIERDGVDGYTNFEATLHA